MVHVATILGAHGIRGEVKVKSLTEVPQAFAAYGPLFTADGRKFVAGKLRAQRDHFICALSNVTDRTAAEALHGTELFVGREKLPALKEGEIYLSDVQGKEAVAGGKSLGRISGFQNFGAGELMELEGGMLIPVSFIASVADAVMLDLPEGYLDDETPLS
ncbi:MAG: 16S rRNA processing protein RimM [Alphaproteobacteria bacterium]|nr:16S rRNA processing protein RimM [Alphaproteobacteria bacterium]